MKSVGLNTCDALFYMFAFLIVEHGKKKLWSLVYWLLDIRVKPRKSIFEIMSVGFSEDVH